MVVHLQAAHSNGSTTRPPVLLCVDDNESMLLLNTEVLSRHGLNVVATDDPSQALSLMELFNVDAVMTDFDMPRMNGGQLATAVKKSRRPRPVILHSGSFEILEKDISNIDGIAPKGQAMSRFLQQLDEFIRLAVVRVNTPGSIS